MFENNLGAVFRIDSDRAYELVFALVYSGLFARLGVRQERDQNNSYGAFILKTSEDKQK